MLGYYYSSITLHTSDPSRARPWQPARTLRLRPPLCPPAPSVLRYNWRDPARRFARPCDCAPPAPPPPLSLFVRTGHRTREPAGPSMCVQTVHANGLTFTPLRAQLASSSLAPSIMLSDGSRKEMRACLAPGLTGWRPMAHCAQTGTQGKATCPCEARSTISACFMRAADIKLAAPQTVERAAVR